MLDREKVVFPVSGLTSFQELATAEGYQTKTHVVLLESVRGCRELMKALDLSRDDEAWRLYRVREIEGERASAAIGGGRFRSAYRTGRSRPLHNGLP